ncbi:MAG: rod shape-determining protein RodA [Planctomycetes bacterium]|jgi:cell division protein FtsW (lipid II flippase)|nr:rod shape-determining protein RodA [Planctomycetota bacterium]
MRNFLGGRLFFVRIALLTSVSILVLLGILMIYVIGNPLETSPGAKLTNLAGYWKKQAVYAVVGVGGFVGANLVNYRRLGAVSYWLYAGVLVLLLLLVVSRHVMPLPLMPEINGAHCWIQFDLGGRAVNLQPSEFCKLAYILALAWYLRYRSNYRSFRALVGPFVLTLVPIVLILVEPDLGTVLLMMPVLFTMLFMAGARVKHLVLIVLLAVLVSPLLWHKIKPYQRSRISAVLLQSTWIRDQAERSPAVSNILIGREFSQRRWRWDWGYHIIHSKLAVASGGLAGAGFGRGDFTKYNFLPFRHTDFIFSVIAHQGGFLACLAFLGLYVIVVLCGLEIAADNIDPFARLLAVGIVAMFVVQGLVNVGMTLGLMPITGLTLPFVSYGGSSLLVNMMAVGLLNNVGRCRPFTVAPKR